MWKPVAVLFAATLLLSAGFAVHALATGVVLPYPHPTPEQAAYEHYHLAISKPLFGTAALAWLLTAVTAFAAGISWIAGRCRMACGQDQ